MKESTMFSSASSPARVIRVGLCERSRKTKTVGERQENRGNGAVNGRRRERERSAEREVAERERISSGGG